MSVIPAFIVAFETAFR